MTNDKSAELQEGVSSNRELLKVIAAGGEADLTNRENSNTVQALRTSSSDTGSAHLPAVFLDDQTSSDGERPVENSSPVLPKPSGDQTAPGHRSQQNEQNPMESNQVGGHNSALQNRVTQNADGSSRLERRNADGSNQVTTRNPDGSLNEDRRITTGPQGLRTTDIVDGSGRRRRETELPGRTDELNPAYHTSGEGAQHLRTDYFDPSDPAGQRITRSTIHAGDRNNPTALLESERSFDNQGRLREQIAYIPFTGYRVESFRADGSVRSTRLNPLNARDQVDLMNLSRRLVSQRRNY